MVLDGCIGKGKCTLESDDIARLMDVYHEIDTLMHWYVYRAERQYFKSIKKETLNKKSNIVGFTSCFNAACMFSMSSSLIVKREHFGAPLQTIKILYYYSNRRQYDVKLLQFVFNQFVGRN